MLDTIQNGLQQVTSPPLVPEDQAIDLAHLFRMTLGDGALQREVLQLFDRQAGMLLARIREGDPSAAAALAHVLKGSARGVGAWQVASAAEGIEAACAGKTDLAPAVEVLTGAIVRARAAIAEHL
ncbi:Hpt domain-containing protein [Xanthobacteraceae bacterium Astr-EGSB]|uniref:Hpt domain-containing protein n=1 Tax=Astrobacterium formosum TaxID=3069710 RepID=UPI0027AE5166|nr:Hpt domain-containing protein [Xanthobacteraceae bacterium Astr-EGSB]